MKNKNWLYVLIVVIVLVVSFLVGRYCFKSDVVNVPPADSRKALISLADLALTLPSNDTSVTNSLVKADRKFYMAFFDKKSDFGKNYFYAKHGSCCPCSPGDMTCCECVGGSGFGGPGGDYRLAQLRELNSQGSVYMLTSNRAVQQYEPLKLVEKTEGGMNIFLIPAGTTSGKQYSVKFQGIRNLEMVIEILNSDGSFKVISYQ